MQTSVFVALSYRQATFIQYIQSFSEHSSFSLQSRDRAKSVVHKSSGYCSESEVAGSAHWCSGSDIARTCDLLLVLYLVLTGQISRCSVSDLE